MKYIRLLLIVDLLYCLEIIVETILKRLEVIPPAPVALAILMAKEVVFLTLLYSLTVILREYGERQSIAAGFYFYMAAVAIYSTVRACYQSQPTGLKNGMLLLSIAGDICLMYQVYRIRHPHLKTPFRLVGAALVLAPLIRVTASVMVFYLHIANTSDLSYYVHATYLLHPFAILLLHTNYLYQQKRSLHQSTYQQ